MEARKPPFLQLLLLRWKVPAVRLQIHKATFDTALYRFYTHPPHSRFYCQTRTCRGEAPPSCCARPFGRLKAPLGLSLLRFAAQTRTCRGGPLHLAYARPFGRLKAPLGLSLLRFAAQTRTTLFLLCTKSYIIWRKIGVWRSFRWKFAKEKSPKLLGTSRSFMLCYLKIGNLLLNRLHRGDRSRKAHKWLYFPL